MSSPIFPTLPLPEDYQGAPVEEAPYEPTEEEKKLIGDIKSKREKWRRDRQPHEQQWYVNQAMFRGQQYVQWSDRDQKLSVPEVPSHRIRLTINRIFPKVRARRAKFLKNRIRWDVFPATLEQRDKMNARATKKILDYQYRRIRLEKKYRQVLAISDTQARGYLWLYWDESVKVRVQMTDPMSGQKVIKEAELGDVGVEVGSPLEILVGDPQCPDLATQEELIRMKMRDVKTLQARYPDKEHLIKASTASTDIFRYQKQMASLSATGSVAQMEDRKNKDGDSTQVLVTEYFVRPCPDYPNGRYVVISGEEVVLKDAELPYGFHDMENPFPCVEFADVEMAGQYWNPTVVEQLIGLQREYNLMRSKLAENIRLMAFPKLLAAKQHNIPPGAWTSEAGEFVEYNAIPGHQPPQPWNPPNISSDVWQTIAILQKEFEDVSQIYPVSEGKAAGATSGFQTNLLQEATDSVHAPDARAHEMVWEELGYKIRRLVKMGYDIPRLVTVAGHGMEPEVFEFSAEQIDENADIVVEAGSSLPDMKAARVQSIVDLYKAGLLGNVQDPEVQRKALQQLEMGTLEESFDSVRKHEELAKFENIMLMEDKPVPRPEFFQNHQVHYNTHTDELNSPEAMKWAPERKMAFMTHLIGHVEYINPYMALNLATEYGLIGVLKPSTLQIMTQPQVPPGQGETGQPQGNQNGNATPGPQRPA